MKHFVGGYLGKFQYPGKFQCRVLLAAGFGRTKACKKWYSPVIENCGVFNTVMMSLFQKRRSMFWAVKVHSALVKYGDFIVLSVSFL